jgi:SAM-dependent methyltransferase
MPEDLDRLYSTFKNSNEGRWILSQKESLVLYSLVKQYQSRTILELGSGIGASVAIMALASEGKAHVVGLEQYEKCIDISKGLIPKELQKQIDLRYVETEAFQEKKISPYIWFSGYKTIPPSEQLYDLVIVDGPGGWLEDGTLITLTCGDIMRMTHAIAPGGIVFIDGRRQTVSLIGRYLSKYFTLVEDRKYCTIFKRTNAPLARYEDIEILDIKLDRRIKLGYFNES